MIAESLARIGPHSKCGCLHRFGPILGRVNRRPDNPRAGIRNRVLVGDPVSNLFFGRAEAILVSYPFFTKIRFYLWLCWRANANAPASHF